MIFRVRSRGSHEVLGRLFAAGLVNGQAPLARHGVAQICWRRLDAEAGVFELGQRALCPVSTKPMYPPSFPPNEMAPLLLPSKRHINSMKVHFAGFDNAM